jgi:ABC-type antimicrobial peptide transport system permease subunit
MLKNYLRTACRNLVKNKIFSTINILGLALGMACSLIIWLWVEDERGIDTFHANDANLYTIIERQYHDGQVDANYNTPGLLAQELKSVFPEVRFATGLPWNEHNTFEAKGKILKQAGSYGSPDFFSVFSYPLLLGQCETSVKSSVDIAVSRKMAVSFFGTPEAAMGQTIRFDNKKDLKITAVFEDVGLNSSRKFDYIINWETFSEQHHWVKDWGNNAPATHIVLQEGTDPLAFESKIKDFLDLYNKNENFVIRLGLQKYSDIYLHSNFKDGEISGGRIQYIKLFTCVAVFVLLIACVNFMNLTTAHSLKRGKEIGVRKVIGAQRGGLIRQFIGEAFLIVVLAFAIAILLIALALPQFNLLTQKEINLPYSRLSFWLVMLILTMVTGFISGSYPALYLSSFNPVKAFKGTLKFSQTARWLRKSLVIFQFTLSIILIVGTIVISRQVNYIQSVNLGYDRENLIFVPLQGDLGTRFDLFKRLITTMPGIQHVSRMSHTPTDIRNGTGGVDWEGKDPSSMLQFTQASVGFDFTKTMDIEIIEGRDYSDHYASDSAGYLVNETALKIIGYKDPIGKPLTFWQKKGTIVGVMKDFHHSSLHHAIAPMILRLAENAPRGWVLVRTSPGKTKDALASLEEVYEKLNPQFPFVYEFSDEAYQKLYGSEQIVETLSNTFASLAILISCLGLLGLTMFTAEQRSKEISIRKILGATMTSLFGLLSKELFTLIGVSLLIASPLAWYVMQDWLSAYVYHITIGWWMFLFAGTITVLIALATISVQTIRTLLINPVSSLRAE